MKAIVLTFDPHAEITELVFRTYERYWPTHPFVFHVPYQDFDRVKTLSRGKRRIEFTCVRPRNIRNTMKELIKDVEDDEWIFWCMVDKFLKGGDGPALDRVCRWLPSLNSSVAGIITGQGDLTKKQLDDVTLTCPDNVSYCAKRNWQGNFYQPHFFRGRVIRGPFLQSRFRDGQSSQRFHRALGHIPSVPGGGKVYVPTRNFLLLGESTYHGKLTPDCIACFRMYGMNPPSHLATTKFNMPKLHRVNGSDAPKWRRELFQWNQQACLLREASTATRKEIVS